MSDYSTKLDEIIRYTGYEVQLSYFDGDETHYGWLVDRVDECGVTIKTVYGGSVAELIDQLWAWAKHLRPDTIEEADDTNNGHDGTNQPPPAIKRAGVT